MPEECKNIIKEDEHDGSDAETNPIYFPPRSQDERIIIDVDDEHDVTNDDFHRACKLAVETKRPLHLTTSFLKMQETIVLRRQETLVIVGCRDSHSTEQNPEEAATTTLQGDLHSLFVLNNFSRLTMRGISLKHTLEPGNGGDHRQVGAAVNLRKKARLVMETCQLHSTCGFCLWIVQKSNVRLQDCHLHATLRSPLVCFGQPTVHLTNCRIVDAGVHALCARGECQVLLEDCQITGSASRAIYAYAQAHMTLVRTIVTGTLRHDKAAIEVSAGSGNDNGNNNDPNAPIKPSKKGSSGHMKIPPKSTLIMRDCKVSDNQGIGVLIRGDVLCDLSNTDYSANVNGNFVETTALQHDDDDDDDDDPQEAPSAVIQGSRATADTTLVDSSSNPTTNATHPSTISGLKRDPSGSSSFRQGDWWCPKCYRDWYNCPSKNLTNPVIVMAGMDECPTCGFVGYVPEYGLTVLEIAGLNRGRPIEFREELLLVVHEGGENGNGSTSTRESAKKKVTLNYQWMFDGDDKGWIPYDAASNALLEEAFQRMLRVQDDEADSTPVSKPEAKVDDADLDEADDEEEDARRSAGLLVTLSQGKYQVDLEKMEQVNTESQMLRFVKRMEVA